MKVRDLPSVKTDAATVTAAFFADAFLSSLPGVPKDAAVGLSNGSYRWTVCRRDPKTGGLVYGLYDPQDLDAPCEMLPLNWYIEEIYGKLLGFDGSKYTYAAIVAKPEARAWCRSIVFDDREAELLFRTDGPNSGQPHALVVIRADASNYNVRAPLVCRGFQPYGPDMFVLFM